MNQKLKALQLGQQLIRLHQLPVIVLTPTVKKLSVQSSVLTNSENNNNKNKKDVIHSIKTEDSIQI